jgi:hypothetical protein
MLDPSAGGVGMKIDLGEIVGGVQQSLTTLARPDKIIAELLDIFRDAHRVLLKMEPALDRLDKITRRLEEKFLDAELSPERFDRLERAIFNIEHATLGVEASLGALPKALRLRIDRGRKQGAGDTYPPPEGPYPR